MKGTNQAQNILTLFQDRVLINQWKDEIINGFKLSAQIMSQMNKKARNKYGMGPAGEMASLDMRNSNVR